MPPALKESETYGHHEDAASLPLVTGDASPKRPSLISRAFNAFWNSCTCCALLGAVCLSCTAVSMRLLADDGMSIFQVVAFRSLFALPIFIPWCYYKTKMLIGPVHAMKWMLARGLFASVAFIGGGFAVILQDVSVAAFLNNSYPALLAFLLWVFAIEAIDWMSWLGIAGTLVSNILIAQPPFLSGEDDEEWTTNRALGLLCSLLCVTFVSLGFLVVSKIDRSVPAMLVANHTLAQLLLMAIPFLAVGFPEKIIWKPSLKQLGLLLVCSSSAFNQIFIVRAFQIGPSIKAAMVALTRVLMITAGGAIVLHEHISILQGLGGALMLGSIALVLWRRNEAQKRRFEAESALSDDL